MTLWSIVYDDETGRSYAVECNPDEVQAVETQQGIKVK